MKKNKLFYLCPFFIFLLLLAGCSAITGGDEKEDEEEEVTKLAAPVLSPADKSSITEDTVISMAVVPNDAAVFYTLDGTDPTMMNGYLYTGSCKLKDLIGFDSSKDTVTLQAKAYKNGYEASNSSSAIYTLIKDTGVYLESLSFDNAVLSETFTKTKFAYSSTVENSVTSVKVKAVNSSGAVIKVNGTVTASNVYSAAINLAVGINNVSLTVTSGTKSNTYAVTITRQSLNPSSDATLSSLSLTNATLAETFDKTKLAYTSAIPYTTTSVTVNVSATSSAATVKIAGTIRTSYTFTPAVGVNTINVDVTAEDGTTVKNYTIAITRASQEVSNDATLSSLSLTNATLAETFDKTKLAYTSAVPYATTSVTVNTSTTSLAATVKIAGTARTSYTFTPAVGLNTINIDVTAEDGTTVKNYTIALTRASQGTAPVVSASPASTNFTDSITVTLSVTPSTTIYYTTNGDAPSTSSSVYSSPLTFTSTTTLKTYVTKDGLNETKTFTYTKGTPSAYYATNPNGKVGVYKSGMNVTCTNTYSDSFADWDESMLIAQGAGFDDAKSFKGVHEYTSWDIYSMYAAWDDTYLYLGWQYVYVNDICASDNDKGTEALPNNGDQGQMLVFDIDPALASVGGQASGIDMWNSSNHRFDFDLSLGVDTMAMFSSKGGVGNPSLFYMNPSTGYFQHATATDTTYAKGFKALGVVYGAVTGLLPSKVWAVKKSNYVPADLNGTTGWTECVAAGHNKAYDQFYEMKIPLSALKITRSYLETKGIGVQLISIYGSSGVDSMPKDMTTLDNALLPYSLDVTTSNEKEDADKFTSPLARIGKL